MIFFFLQIDGYCEIEGRKLVFQFQGDYFHGCLCMPGGRDVPLTDDPNDTLDERRRRTIVLNERLKAKGYEV